MTCKYTFTTANGEVSIDGLPALKAWLTVHGLESITEPKGGRYPTNPQLVSAPQQAQAAAVEPTKPEEKVFKTKAEAQKASKAGGNTTRVKQIKGKDGKPAFMLRDATEKELAAAAKAGRRFAAAKTVDVQNDPLLVAIAKLGGLAMSEKADTIGQGNKLTAGGHVFTNGGKSIDIMANEDLWELGYIPAYEHERDGGTTWLQGAIKSEFVGTRQHFSERGEKWMEDLQAEAEARYDEEYDPLGDLDYDDLESIGYNGASPDVQAATEEILAAAAELGIDVDLIRENADSATRGLPDERYHAEIERLAKEAIEQARGNAVGIEPGQASPGDQDRGQGVGNQGQAGAPEGLRLSAQTTEELRAKAEREAAAAQADKAEQARLKREADQARESKELGDRLRQDLSAEGFELGQSQEDVIRAMAGNADLFGEPAQTTAPTAAKQAPKSFRKSFMVETSVFVEGAEGQSGSFEQHRVDADSALKALDDDLAELRAFRACIAGG